MDTHIMSTSDIPVVGARKVDVNRGALDGSASSQWWRRPDDQRFLTMAALKASVMARKELCQAGVVATDTIVAKADPDDDESLWIEHDGQRIDPTHWSFGQLCQRVKAPASNLREDVPGVIAALYLQSRLHRSENENLGMMVMKSSHEENATMQLRALTGPDYGRIYDAEVVEVVERILGDGTWKVPGQIDWSTGIYDPNRPVTKRSTTLYASDRDLFIFLCRDQHPIKIGVLDNGDPDYVFPGAIISNSEVGSRSLSIETMYLRGICENRNLWGVEDKQVFRLRHTKGLPSRFVGEAVPRLEDFSNIAASSVVAKVQAAQKAKVGKDDDEVKEWMGKKGFGKAAVKQIFDTVLATDGKPPRSIWDIVQGATAKARDLGHQDARVEAEREAGKLMDLVKV